MLFLELGAWDTALSVLNGFFTEGRPQVSDPVNSAHLFSIAGFAQTSQGGFTQPINYTWLRITSAHKQQYPHCKEALPS